MLAAVFPSTAEWAGPVLAARGEVPVCKSAKSGLCWIVCGTRDKGSPEDARNEEASMSTGYRGWRALMAPLISEHILAWSAP